MTRPSPARFVTALVVVGATAAVAVLGARWVADELAPPGCVLEAGGTQVSLTPEQTANAATIAGGALRHELGPRAATIALATAIQESKLRNLRYGDRDSVGLFQQRPSQGWGTVEEILDPVFATDAFYDALARVPGWETGVVTEVAQEVQRSAFPDAYADHEGEARVLASVLTGQELGDTLLHCDLEPAAGAGSGQVVADKVDRQLGVSGQVAADDRSVTFELGSAEHAWAVAAWAVGHAEAEGTLAVTVGDRRWQRETSALPWAEAATPVGPTTVVVELG